MIQLIAHGSNVSQLKRHTQKCMAIINIQINIILKQKHSSVLPYGMYLLLLLFLLHIGDSLKVDKVGLPEYSSGYICDLYYIIF